MNLIGQLFFLVGSPGCREKVLKLQSSPRDGVSV